MTPYQQEAALDSDNDVEDSSMYFETWEDYLKWRGSADGPR